ncbi:tetratricopeptide repeat protein [Fimbriiglobus ruber]|uniref:TPR repeat protein n=1 Tax=Fimbriiglobus ruber TaxID=1908690 RepID=A0A225D182_9BACT|nr:tetratricopeptide repeat protein [Fimbriiglobus ruber]OWK34693.1 TPR repeat protein [Fimbriiglobus ruber]
MLIPLSPDESTGPDLLRLPSPKILALLSAGAIVVGIGSYYLHVESSGTAQLLRAREAITARDFSGALRSLEAYSAGHPDDAEALLLAAQTARRAGDGTAFERYLQRYATAGGGRVPAELERDMWRTQTGDLSAYAGVLRFCQAHPDHPTAPLMLESAAVGCLAANRPNEAVTCTDLWMKGTLSPEDRAEALFLRGRGLEGLGRMPEAAEDYRRVLEQMPTRDDARLRLAQFLTREEPREALTLFERLERDGQKSLEVRLGMARCRRQLGEIDKAGAILDQLATENPRDLAVLTEAGALDLDRGRLAQAETRLRQALSINPNTRDANVHLARCLSELGRDGEARDQFAKVKRIEDELLSRLQPVGKKP